MCGPRILVAKTCNFCGELRDAKCFPRIKGVYYNSWCKSCASKTYRRKTQRHQERSKEAAVNHRSTWTETDFRKMEEMTAEGRTAAQIALALNRSVYAINSIRYKMKRGIV